LFLEKIERPSFCREFEGFAGFVVGPGKGTEGSNVGGCWAEGIPNTCLEWLAQPLKRSLEAQWEVARRVPAHDFRRSSVLVTCHSPLWEKKSEL
jgi:hypothetical protein